MDKTFNINVDNQYELELSEQDISSLNMIQKSTSKFHIILNNLTHNARVIDSDFNKKQYKVKVNNNTYNININSDLDVLIKQMGFETGASKKIDSIKAPMPGLILDINVKNGQEVNEDDTLLILEAMKMENVISSPRSGIIKSIHMKKGDAVEKNQLLIEFE